MIEEQYVSFETAKLAKEKGFDIPTRYGFSERGTLVRVDTSDNWNQDEGFYSRPTQSLLARWLREKYKLNVSVMEYIDEDGYDLWMYCLRKGGKTDSLKSKADFETYEEALEAGLQEALELYY